MPVFALVDCNNFYASCERLFQPRLRTQPIIVLSNNDGCVVARSQEAKQLDIKMGTPYFKVKALCDRHNVAVFSSNYQLYGDLSQRVMETLRQFTPDLEVYSIDEAFLSLDGFSHLDVAAYAQEIRTRVGQWTGIPVSIGIGPTKTLAKIANHVAKRRTQTGVFDLRDQTLQSEILATLPVQDIWGIGRRWAKKLPKFGIQTALQLREADPALIRRHFTVVGERLVRELNGDSCLPLENLMAKQNIMSSKSFGSLQTEFQPIAEALSCYAARACEKMRGQGSKAQGIHVMLRTSKFRQDCPQYSNGMNYGFPAPTSDTRVIAKAAKHCLAQIYRPGYAYQKTGVMLTDLISDSVQQQDLFQRGDDRRSERLMAVMDALNAQMGRKALYLAAQGNERSWRMRCDRRSPRYTTQWEELPTVS
ncbi:MAG: Y-family DNA polymerase [Pseudanabaenales cyanobacterium]|nr:Y-family DNA polymerase [Pseudanabaenales cyanobacterium]